MQRSNLFLIVAVVIMFGVLMLPTEEKPIPVVQAEYVEATSLESEEFDAFIESGFEFIRRNAGDMAVRYEVKGDGDLTELSEVLSKVWRKYGYNLKIYILVMGDNDRVIRMSENGVVEEFL